jgi:hypothetical protein
MNQKLSVQRPMCRIDRGTRQGQDPNFEAVVLLIPIPCPRSKTVLASSQVGALTLLRQRLSRP